MAACQLSARQPWRAPLERWIARLQWEPGVALALASVNELAAGRGCTSGSGAPIVFADAANLIADTEPYERRIFDSGVVATRLSGAGALHDAFNALAWLAFPRTKAALNRLHASALDASQPTGRRGPLRDRTTLFDESGALILTQNAELALALRDFDWATLFVRERHRFQEQARCLVLGHAVQEKLCHPYKAVCVQAWLMDVPVDCPIDEIDRLAADRLDTAALDALTPLPVLGVPGWWPANEEPEFYNDPTVFRRRRSR